MTYECEAYKIKDRLKSDSDTRDAYPSWLHNLRDVGDRLL